MSMHVPFEDLLERAAGRTVRFDAAHLARCPHCRERVDAAHAIVAAGRRALAAPRPGRRAMARAVRAFRDGSAPPVPAFRLVLDTLLRAAPALRSRASARSRFLRFEGPATLELQVTTEARAVELRGQITPKGFAKEVVLRGGRARRRTRIGADGTFLFRKAPRGVVRVTIGDAAIDRLEL